jgi:anti-sigma B factor antagonist
MEISTRDVAGWRVLAPRGEVDSHTAPALEEAGRAALAAGVGRVAVDLGGVPYSSSAGLRVLLLLLRLAQAGGIQLVLCAPQAQVREVLEVSGFAPLFDVRADADHLG